MRTKLQVTIFIIKTSFNFVTNTYITRDTSIYECVCNVGYHGDGYTCELEINCLNQPSLCSENAQCTQTAAGLQCVCHTGFIGNGSVCTKPPRLDSGFLLLSQGVATVRIPFDGKRGQPVSMSNVTKIVNSYFCWSNCLLYIDGNRFRQGLLARTLILE